MSKTPAIALLCVAATLAQTAFAQQPSTQSQHDSNVPNQPIDGHHIAPIVNASAFNNGFPATATIRDTAVRPAQFPAFSPESAPTFGETSAPSDTTATGASQFALSALSVAFFFTPNFLLDFHDGSNQSVLIRNTVSHAFYVQGTLTSGIAGDPNAGYAFEADGIGGPDDFFTTGAGTDASGDMLADTYSMTEPLPPNEVPTNPGPGFAYDGGTVTYTRDQSTTQAVNGAPQDGEDWYAEYSFSQTEQLVLPGVGGVAVRRIKLAENNSPVPRDRFFVDYRFFNDVRNGLGDVNRYSFGVEKTFLDGEASLEARFPFAATLDSVQFENAVLARDFEMGNFVFTYKHVLWADERLLFSAGLGVAVPTGDDTRLFRTQGPQILHIENEAVHLLPFIGTLWTPNDNCWLQGFMQLDVDANGNRVHGDATGAGLPRIGVLQDSTWMFLDVSAGRWLYQGDGRIQRAGVLAELHYNLTLNDADIVSGNGITVTDFANRLDVVNATAGMHFLFRDNWSATAGMTVPLGTEDNKQMDFEAAVLINKLY